MTSVDIASVQKIIEDVAATEIMPRFRNLEQSDIEMKGADDPVTVADKAAEDALTKRLKDILPGSVVVGEECCFRDQGILSSFNGEEDVWVIDPIDGTRNFIEGRREFGVMVALVRGKQTVAAWIHDPSSGHTLSGEQGGGVCLQGHKMRLVRQDQGLPRLVIVGSRLKKTLARPNVASIVAGLPALAIGSAAAFDYPRLFTGDVLFAGSMASRAQFLLYRVTKPWDHMPGLFLHTEAGGYSADFYGDPYDPNKSENGLLVAPDKWVWTEFFETIKPVIGELFSPKT